MPDNLYLFKDSCGSVPLISQNVTVDSNGVSTLSLSSYNLEIDKTYKLLVERNSSIGTLDFDIGIANYSPTPGCSPSPCPVACNKLYNGSFEEELTVPTPTYWDRNIHFSKGWIRPNTTNYSADYYHRNSLDPDSEVPTSFFGTHHAVDGLDGNDAYAGLFTLNENGGNFREWMSGTLNEPLIQGHKYTVIMYANLVAHSIYDSPCVAPGLKFSTSPFTNETSSSIVAMTADIQSSEVITNPSDWVKISGEYIAQGGEQYVNIANFMSNAESVGSYPLNNSVSYFFVDAVSVTDMGACCDNVLVIENGWDVDDVLSAPEFAPFISGNVLSTTAQVKVDGAFTINQNFEMDNTHFVMAANAEITLASGVDLTINESILEVCGNTMWNGITVDDETSEVIISSSEIWEAKKGINSMNGGKFTVSNTLFDGNNYGIYVDTYTDTHEGTVQSSVFKSTDYLLNPYSGARATAGIYVNKVNNTLGTDGITIGNSTSLDNKNFFQGPGIPSFSGPAPGLMYGIRAYNSSVKVFNSEFENFIAMDIVDPSRKAGIYFEGIDIPTNSTPSVTIGGHTAFEKNEFNNSTKGILIDSCFIVNIKNNDFDMSGLEGSTAIDHSRNYSHLDIIIVDNTILDTETGIRLNDSRGLTNLAVDRNIISLLGNNISTGIDAQLVYANIGTSYSSSISRNIIENGTRGIILDDVSDISEIDDNIIEISNTIYNDITSTPIPNYGIRISNSNNISQIKNNEINTTSPTSDTRVYGMSIEMTSFANNITCNTIENTGTAIHFGGVIVPSWNVEELYGNEMKGNHNGLVLTNNSELGDVGNSSNPSDNKWTGTYTGNHTYTDGADGSQTTLWTRSGGLPYVPQTNSGIPIPMSINSSATGNAYDCGGGIIIGPGTFSQTNSSVVNSENTSGTMDFSNSNFSDTTLWLANYQAYRSLPHDSLISNSSIQDYKDSMAFTPMGKLLDIRNQMNTSLNVQQVQLELNNISTSNQLEVNLKEVIEIALDIKVNQLDTLPLMVSSYLNNLGNACPFVEGPAVYDARNILSNYADDKFINLCELYNSSSPNLRIKDSSIKSAKEASGIMVYPNPTKEKFTISMEMKADATANIHVFDINGKKVLESILISGNNEITTRKLDSGIYFYHIVVNNELKQKEKLIIL